ncbi:Diaminopimelate decarboxylase [Trichinella spiralis]|uniref:Diaminopimelate decarboxylase n=1 Tax=Trichinella spiralis TaxID=6334 RepID=A0ABR3KHR3_TRISP
MPTRWRDNDGPSYNNWLRLLAVSTGGRPDVAQHPLIGAVSHPSLSCVGDAAWHKSRRLCLASHRLTSLQLQSNAATFLIGQRHIKASFAQ